MVFSSLISRYRVYLASILQPCSSGFTVSSIVTLQRTGNCTTASTVELFRDRTAI